MPELKAAYLSKDYQRMWDLCRQMRAELMDAGLIDIHEYAALASEETMNKPGQGSPAPRRLESYDELRAKLKAAEAALLIAHEAQGRLQEEVHVLKARIGDHP